MKFSQVIGHHEKKKAFIKSVLNGRVPHAQLFTGASGWGTLPLALAYAQFVSCLDRGADDSCGVCSSCRKYENLSHPDLHFTFPFPREKGERCSELIGDWRKVLAEHPYMNLMDWMQLLDAEKKQANIPTAEIRDILKNLSLKPYESAFKVMFIWLPEFLGKEGNILLKAIEEPAHNTLFLLVTENTEKILGTIISRTQPVRIAPIDPSSLREYLKRVPDLDGEKADRIAQISQGDLRNAGRLVQASESPYFEMFRYWMGVCVTRKMFSIVPWAEKVGAMSRENLKGFFQYALEVMRGILVSGYEPSLNTWMGKEAEFIQKFQSLEIPTSQLEQIINQMETAMMYIERNARAPMVLTDLSYTVARNLKKV